jgi:outer membrane receptor protein involved in Fe transport
LCSLLEARCSRKAVRAWAYSRPCRAKINDRYLDAQATFDITDQARIMLTASNLTDTVDQAWEGSRDRLLQLGRAGRTVSLTFRWTL